MKFVRHAPSLLVILACGCTTGGAESGPLEGKSNSSRAIAPAPKIVNPSQAAEVSNSEITPAQKAKIDEFQMELQIGRNMAGRLLARYGTLSDKRVVNYINEVGLYVAGQSDAPDRRYMFEILNDETVNAFACPGGYIFVTLGALRLAETEAELAMILGHEIAHVSHQHIFNTMKVRSREQAEKSAKKGKPLAKEILVRQRPSPPPSGLASSLARYLMSQGGAGMSMLGAVEMGLSLVLDEGLDPKMEFEADSEGAKYAIRSGYKDDAMLDYLVRIKARKAQNAQTTTLDKTHPKIDERSNHLIRVLEEFRSEGTQGAEVKQRFLTYRALLPAPKPKVER